MMLGTIFVIAASLLWGLLHSLLAARSVKDGIRHLSGPVAFDRLYRFSYNFFAIASFFPIVMMLAVYPDSPLYTIPAPWVYLTSVVQGLAVIVLIATLMQTDPFEFLGLRQLNSVEPPTASTLVTDGWYAYVRHPLYVASLVLLWLIYDMTINRLVVCAALTLYLLIGAYFEERKLLTDYGAAYAAYKERVPMFIPRFRTPKS